MRRLTFAALSVLALGLVWSRDAASQAIERALFGEFPGRNSISTEKGLPTTFDVDSGVNVLWAQPTGSQSYAGPIVVSGRVYVGTNNEGRRNPKLSGDKGVVMAFDAKTGEFVWQAVTDKLPSGRVNDWPQQGVCSTPFVEGDRLFYTSNQARIVSVDVHGFKNGNDGVTTEKEQSPIDADIVWDYDLMGELDVFPHNLAASSPLVVDGVIYVTTGNGVDESHINIPSPLAPSFVAIDAKTGKLVWESAEPGKQIIHGNWSNAAYGVVQGRAQVVFGGGDGWVYSFEPKTGKLLWKFDANPKDAIYRLGGSGTKNDIISTPVVHGDTVYIGVGQDPEHGEGVGNFYALDATLSGDVTGRAVRWRRGGDEFRRTISTAAIHDGIVYISDLSGFLYALDEKTGQLYWKHDMLAAVWGSPYIADGKVYLGDEDGDVTVMALGKTAKVLGESNLGSAVYATPYAKDGVLYILARNKLFAFKEGAKAAK
jgi:outer membrane protein assembly factor BamB